MGKMLKILRAILLLVASLHWKEMIRDRLGGEMIMIMIVGDLNYVCQPVQEGHMIMIMIMILVDLNYVNLFKRDAESVVAGKLLRA